MASVYNDTSICNGYAAFLDVCKYFINKDVSFRFRFSRSLIFTKILFLDDGLYQKTATRYQRLLSQ